MGSALRLGRILAPWLKEVAVLNTVAYYLNLKPRSTVKKSADVQCNSPYLRSLLPFYTYLFSPHRLKRRRRYSGTKVHIPTYLRIALSGRHILPEKLSALELDRLTPIFTQKICIIAGVGWISEISETRSVRFSVIPEP